MSSPLSTTLGSSTAGASAFLKRLFDDKTINDLGAKDRPLLTMINKDTNYIGDGYTVVPLLVGRPHRNAPTFSTAQGKTSTGTYRRFLLERKNLYGLVEISGEVIEAAKSKGPGAFADMLELETRLGFESHQDTIAKALYGVGNGVLGQVSAEPTETASTFNIVLKNWLDVYNFEVGMELEIWTATVAGTRRNSDGSDDEWVVSAISIDRATQTSTITLTGTYDSSGTIAADNYIFENGFHQTAAGDSVFFGLRGFLPSSAVSGSDSFLGLNRSTDEELLAGLRYTQSAGESYTELFNNCAMLLKIRKAKPSHVFVNPIVFSKIANELESKGIINKEVAKVGKIGFEGLEIITGSGTIKIIADPFCPSAYGFMLQLDTWTLKSLGNHSRFVETGDHMGKSGISVYNDDAVEIRLVGRMALVTNAPAWNAIIIFA